MIFSLPQHYGVPAHPSASFSSGYPAVMFWVATRRDMSRLSRDTEHLAFWAPPNANPRTASEAICMPNVEQRSGYKISAYGIGWRGSRAAVGPTGIRVCWICVAPTSRRVATRRDRAQDF